MKQLNGIVKTVIDASKTFAEKKWSTHLLLTLFFILFVAVTIVVNVWHEPWIDEIEPWLIASTASMHTMLFELPGYLGTPMLWHLLLVPFAVLGFPYTIVQAVNAVFVVGIVAVLLWLPPFPLWARVALAFNFYTLYEYNAVARSYSMTALLLLVIAYAYRWRVTHPWVYIGVLILLSQTSAYGLLFAGVYLLVFSIERGIGVYTAWPNNKNNSTHWLLPVFFGGVALASTAVLLLPANDIASHLAVGKYISLTLVVDAFNVYLPLAFFPTVMLGVHYWSQSIILPYLQLVPVGLLLYPLLLVFFWTQNRAATALWFIGSTVFIFFSVIVYHPAQRHLGLLFFFCISVIWIQWSSIQNSAAKKYILGVLCVVCFLVQVASATIAIAQEKKYVFSSIAETAAAVPAGSSDTTVIVYPAYLTTGILPFLNGRYDAVYSLEQQQYIQYIRWNSLMRVNVPIEECEPILGQALENISSPHVIMVSAISTPCTKKDAYEVIWTYPEMTVVPYQQFEIYRLR